MRFEIVCVLFLAGNAWFASATSDKTSVLVEEPRYDPSTEVRLLAVISEVREVARGNPLEGIHLIVRLETQETQLMDIYLGPASFLKQFDITFAKGDEVKVLGSKVKFPGGAHVILAREIRKENATLSCRQAKGVPNWE